MSLILTIAAAAAMFPAVLSAQDAAPANSETENISGTVVDASDGYPLIGVSVMLEGTLHGVAPEGTKVYTLMDVM